MGVRVLIHALVALLLLGGELVLSGSDSLHETLVRLGLEQREQALLDEGWDAEGIRLATEQDLVDSGLEAAEAQKLLRAVSAETASAPPPAPPGVLEVGLVAALARAGLGHRAEMMLEAGWENVEDLKLAELEDLLVTGLEKSEAERLKKEVSEPKPTPAVRKPTTAPTPPQKLVARERGEGVQLSSQWVNPNPGAARSGTRSKAVTRVLAEAACEQYTDLLFEAGWDDLQTLKLASWEELVYTGLKPGHAKRLHAAMHSFPADGGGGQSCTSGSAGGGQPSAPEPLAKRGDGGAKKVLTGTDLNLASILASHDLVLLDLYAPWCGHCQALEPQFASAAAAVGGDDPATFVKVDVTANQQTAVAYGVKQLPTIKLVKAGEVVDDYGGQRVAHDIIEYIKQQEGRPAGASTTAGGASTQGSGEPQIVTRNGEERIYIPIDRSAAAAAAATAGGVDEKPAYNDDKKPAYNDDKKQQTPTRQQAPNSGKPAYNDDKKPAYNDNKKQQTPTRQQAPNSGKRSPGPIKGGATQMRGKKKPTWAQMEQVGLDQLQPGRGYTLEQWVFEPQKHGNTPLIDAGALQVDFAIDVPGSSKRKKVVAGVHGAPEIARVMGLMAAPDKQTYFQGLADGKGFFRMDLVGQALGPRGAEIIAPNLGKMVRATGLKEIHFEFNNFGDEGTVTIIKALQGSGINALHLSENQITDDGIAALTPHLLQMPELSILFIGGNRFADAGVRSLAEFAERSVSLSGIRVNNCYDEEGYYIEPSAGALRALDSVEGVELDR